MTISTPTQVIMHKIDLTEHKISYLITEEGKVLM